MALLDHQDGMFSDLLDPNWPGLNALPPNQYHWEMAEWIGRIKLFEAQNSATMATNRHLDKLIIYVVHGRWFDDISTSFGIYPPTVWEIKTLLRGWAAAPEFFQQLTVKLVDEWKRTAFSSSPPKGELRGNQFPNNKVAQPVQ